MTYIRVGPTERTLPTVTGGTAGLAPLTSLLTALASQGWIIDATTGPQLPNAPTSQAATGIGSVSFTANWIPPTTDSSHDPATGYLLDVATDAGFTAFVAGYNGAVIANVTTSSVVGLAQTTNYWYRVRATNPAGASGNSAPIGPVTTTTAPVTQTLFPTAMTPANDQSYQLLNSWSGEYRWGGNASSLGWPTMDIHAGMRWKDLEPNGPGENEGWASLHGLIDQRLANAMSTNGRHMTIIACVASEYGNPPNSSPLWFLNDARANSFNVIGIDGLTYICPDFNSDFWLTRMDVLFTEIARYVADKPAWSMYQTGCYGNWGEWHMYPFDANPSGPGSGFPGPNGQVPITLANVQRLINSMYKLHHPERGQFLLALTDNGTQADYALSLLANVGIENAAMGSTGYGGDYALMHDPAHALLTRWKTGPFITEWDFTNTGAITTGEPQTRVDHISSVGGGLLLPNIVASNPGLYATLILEAGYRYQLDSVTLPTVITRGAAFTFTAVWENRNVAPTYDPWAIMWQLRSQSTGAIVWEQASAYNLLSLTDSSVGQFTINDTLTVPGSVPAGTYNISVEVRTASTVPYLAPMALNLVGRAGNGSYQIGTVSVV